MQYAHTQRAKQFGKKEATMNRQRPHWTVSVWCYCCPLAFYIKWWSIYAKYDACAKPIVCTRDRSTVAFAVFFLWYCPLPSIISFLARSIFLGLFILIFYHKYKYVFANIMPGYIIIECFLLINRKFTKVSKWMKEEESEKLVHASRAIVCACANTSLQKDFSPNKTCRRFISRGWICFCSIHVLLLFRVCVSFVFLCLPFDYIIHFEYVRWRAAKKDREKQKCIWTRIIKTSWLQ